MSDPIPYEDNITHTQLWKRIDGNRDTVEQEIGQANDHWQSSVAAIVAKVANLIKDNETFMDNTKAQFENDFKQEVLKAAQFLVMEANAKMMIQIKADQKEINDHFLRLEELIHKTIEDEFKIWTTGLSVEVKAMRKEIDDFKKDQNDSLVKATLSLSSKVSDVNAKLDDVLTKLRVVLKDL